jgi:hypothetical protein
MIPLFPILLDWHPIDLRNSFKQSTVTIKYLFIYMEFIYCNVLHFFSCKKQMATKMRIDSSWPFGFPYPDPPAFYSFFPFRSLYALPCRSLQNRMVWCYGCLLIPNRDQQKRRIIVTNERNDEVFPNVEHKRGNSACWSAEKNMRDEMRFLVYKWSCRRKNGSIAHTDPSSTKVLYEIRL